MREIMGLVSVGTDDQIKDYGFPPDDHEFPLDIVCQQHTRGFGERLKQARVESGFKSARALSVRVGLSDGTVKSYETGGQEPKLSVLVKLALACRVSIDWLANGTGPMAYPQVGDRTASGEDVVHGPMIIQSKFYSMPEPPPQAPTSQLFGSVDVDRAAKALRAVDALFRSQNSTPTDRERGQAFALIYQYLWLQDEDAKSSDNIELDSKSTNPIDR